MPKIKHPKLWRYITFWIEAFFLAILPVYLTGNEYKLFKAEYYSWWKWTTVGFLLFLLLIIYFRKQLSRWLDSLPMSVGKGVIDFFFTVMPYAILFGMVEVAKVQIDVISVLTLWILMSAVAGALVRQVHLFFREYHIETTKQRKYGGN